MGWNVLVQQSTPIRYRLVTLLAYTLIAYTFVACSSANPPPAGSPPTADLTRTDWNNFTYPGLCNPDQGDHVTVKNGTAIDSGSWGKSLIQVYRPTFGELTGDGQPEAVVPYSCSDIDPNSPIQGTVYVHVIIFSGNPAHPVVIGQFPPWPGNSNSLRTIRTVDFVNIDHGMLQLIGGGFSGEGPASLDLQITDKYRWTGSHFEPVSSQAESFTSNPRPGSNGQQLEFVCSGMVSMNVEGTNQSGQHAEWGWHQVATGGLTWGWWWVGPVQIQWKDQAGTVHEYDHVRVPRLYSLYIYHTACAYGNPSTTTENPLGKVDWTKVVTETDLGCNGPTGPHLGVQVDEKQFADVTGDGKKEAFVAVACVASTSSWPDRLEVFDGASDPAHPRLIATLLDYKDGTDERGLRIGSNVGIPQSITISGRTVTIVSLGYAPTDPNASLSRQITDTFTWKGSGFTRGPRSVVQAKAP